MVEECAVVTMDGVVTGVIGIVVLTSAICNMASSGRKAGCWFNDVSRIDGTVEQDDVSDSIPASVPTAIGEKSSSIAAAVVGETAVDGITAA